MEMIQVIFLKTKKGCCKCQKFYLSDNNIAQMIIQFCLNLHFHATAISFNFNLFTFRSLKLIVLD